MIMNAAVVYLRLEAAAAAVALDHEEWRWVIRILSSKHTKIWYLPARL